MASQQPFLQDAHFGEPLEEFVRKTQEGGPIAILREYRAVQLMDRNQTSPTGDKNPHLNRGGDVRCFESTRVKLDPPRDYIHANYVDGFRHPKKFICTQAPLSNTINNFWRMVWQEKTVLIIALTKVGGADCEIYFPDQEQTSILAEGIRIKTRRIVHVRKTYEKCVFQVSKGGVKRTVILLLYYAWPDKSIPDSSTELLNFMEQYGDWQMRCTNKLILEKQWRDKNFGPPIVVHCSTGVGKTGTLCALDVITERLRWTKEMGGVPLIDIPKTVTILRTQRHKAVHRPEQYMFLYLVTLEYSLRHDLIEPEKVDLRAFERIENTN